MSERNIDAFHKDMDALGFSRPDRMPRATQCLDGIRSLIGELEAKGSAYSADGDALRGDEACRLWKAQQQDLSEQQDNASAESPTLKRPVLPSTSRSERG